MWCDRKKMKPKPLFKEDVKFVALSALSYNYGGVEETAVIEARKVLAAVEYVRQRFYQEGYTKGKIFDILEEGFPLAKKE